MNVLVMPTTTRVLKMWEENRAPEEIPHTKLGRKTIKSACKKNILELNQTDVLLQLMAFLRKEESRHLIRPERIGPPAVMWSSLSSNPGIMQKDNQGKGRRRMANSVLPVRCSLC
ncbi:uncharacterized protein LOC144210464 [Stigmatopora nigra]